MKASTTDFAIDTAPPISDKSEVGREKRTPPASRPYASTSVNGSFEP
jgi:hypothetical protein